jgi:hypothetical protein
MGTEYLLLLNRARIPGRVTLRGVFPPEIPFVAVLTDGSYSVVSGQNPEDSGPVRDRVSSRAPEA